MEELKPCRRLALTDPQNVQFSSKTGGHSCRSPEAALAAAAKLGSRFSGDPEWTGAELNR